MTTFADQEPKSPQRKRSARPHAAKPVHTSPNPLAGYKVSDREQVEKVLRQRRSLIPLLQEMKEAVAAFFPEGEQLLLSPMWDAPNSLIVSVVTRSANAYTQLEQFDEAWAQPRWKRLAARLNLTVVVP
jgi:hypothetical protein